MEHDALETYLTTEIEAINISVMISEKTVLKKQYL